jgi:hypothetical protein
LVASRTVKHWRWEKQRKWGHSLWSGYKWTTFISAENNTKRETGTPREQYESIREHKSCLTFNKTWFSIPVLKSKLLEYPISEEYR